MLELGLLGRWELCTTIGWLCPGPRLSCFCRKRDISLLFWSLNTPCQGLACAFASTHCSLGSYLDKGTNKKIKDEWRSKVEQCHSRERRSCRRKLGRVHNSSLWSTGTPRGGAARARDAARAGRWEAPCLRGPRGAARRPLSRLRDGGTALAPRRGCPYIMRSAGIAGVETFGSAAALLARARSEAAATMKTSFFHIIKTKTELIPLAGIVSFAAIGAFSFSIYSLFCKSDVIINKSSNPEPWETVDATKPQKLLTVRQKWKPIEELESVKKLTK
ncbi:normal mucosa of esophagus-specific gene 1 protein [Amazona ochrocephala]